VCVYSLRARPRPFVSTPIEWKEVRAALKKSDAELLSFDFEQVLRRVKKKGDLFGPVLVDMQRLPNLKAIKNKA
ncbi:MAG TPA: ATP-dependent DNA ligase, partial [Actinomycetota bacterium]|nr:ATP-dependent DNA ligase [Actinomycetota bacterium]